MKKYILALFIIFILSASATWAKVVQPATPKSSGVWKPTIPDGYVQITWAKAPGIATFFKAPNGNGSIDFLTRIYLPQNQIDFILSSSTPVDRGLAKFAYLSDVTASAPAMSDIDGTDPFFTDSSTVDKIDMSNFHNYSFARLVAEMVKGATTTAQFIWNAPFFNIMASTTDLSMALKLSVGTTTLITSGSRPNFDMARNRRMFVVNNKTGTATIQDFDSAIFVSSSIGDQAFEGFAPTVVKTDGAGTATARLFLGVSTSSKELVIYCSQQATVRNASDALLAAGVPVERQLEADGGGSATCGYNLPGQFFVEPTRMLPLLMGATTILGRGIATTNDLNVRGGPSTKHPIVIKLPKNASVRIFEEKNGWYRIGAGQWVLKSLIKKI